MPDTNPLIDTINNQFKPVVKIKNDHVSQLNEKLKAFPGFNHKDAGFVILVFTLTMMDRQEGTFYQREADKAWGAGAKEGSITGCKEDTIRVIALERDLANRFTSEATKGQNLFNDGKSKNVKISDIIANLNNISGALDRLEQADLKSNSPFDKASADSIRQSIGQIKTKLQDAIDKFGVVPMPGAARVDDGETLKRMFAAAGTATDTDGASAIVNGMNQGFTGSNTAMQATGNTVSAVLSMETEEAKKLYTELKNLFDFFSKGCKSFVDRQVA